MTLTFKAICPSTLGLVPGAVLAIMAGMQINILLNEWELLAISVSGAGFGLLTAYFCSFAVPIKAAGMRRLIGGLVAAGVLGLALNVLSLKWDPEVVQLLHLQSGFLRTETQFVPVALISIGLALGLSGRLNGSRYNDPKWLILIGIVLAIVLTGTAVVTLGSWTMVGLIASALARWLARGKDYRIVLPVAAMTGAALVSLLNTLSFVVNPPFEVPFRTVTGLIGLPLLALLIWREANLYTAADRTTVR